MQIAIVGLAASGKTTVFNTLTREDIASYYREKYAPNNVFFVVVGDFEPAVVEKQPNPENGERPWAVLPESEVAKIRAALPDERLWIAFRHVDEDSRELKFTGTGKRYIELLNVIARSTFASLSVNSATKQSQNKFLRDCFASFNS